jgi:hypothetical protein
MSERKNLGLLLASLVIAIVAAGPWVLFCFCYYAVWVSRFFP